MSPGARLGAFDGLRAVAAVSILAFHAAHATGALGSAAGPWLVHLDVGVAVFFLISGFLLYRPFVLARLTGDAPPQIVPYAVRRVLRIGPAYWLALPLVALWLGRSDVFSLDHGLRYAGFAQVYSAETLTGGMAQAWTLAIEATFYAALPVWVLLMRRVPARGRRQVLRVETVMLAGAFAGSVLWKLAAAGGLPAGQTLSPAVATLPAFMDHFALGMGLAVLSAALSTGARPGVRAPAGWAWGAWAGAAALFVAIGALEALREGSVTHDLLLRHEVKGLIALGLVAPALWPAVAGTPAGVLSWRPLRWAGQVSYGVFLWHLAVVMQLGEWGWHEHVGALGFGIAALAASLALGWLSWRLVERPAIALGRRIGRAPAPAPAPAAIERVAHGHAAP